MIDQWFNAQRKSKRQLSPNGGSRDNRDNHEFGRFEKLEDKICLAFLGFFDGVTLDILQTADDGDVLVENSTGVWRATDNLSTFTYVNATNVTVTMLDNTANRLDFALETEHAGNVELHLGDGVHDLFFLGGLNTMGGDLVITGGDDTQQADLSFNTALTVIGSANIDLGQGFDSVLVNGQINGDLNVTGVNDFDGPSLTVGLFPGPPFQGGDVTFDTTNEDTESFSAVGGGTIWGDFTYTGGPNVDSVNLGGVINQNVNIDLGISTPFIGAPQSVDVSGTVTGDTTIVAGDSFLGNEITFSGLAMGDVMITAGDTPAMNEIILIGETQGNVVSYTGGNQIDVVNYALAGLQADVFANMGSGDDIFRMFSQVNLLEIDFGNDLGDVFENNVGQFNFEYDILNFQFFDHFYTVLDDTLVMNQLIDTGDILLANGGGILGFDWTMLTGLGGITSTSPAENLILNMLPNTNNHVEVDLFNPVINSITMNLGDGDRDIRFTGFANNPLRDIVINAGAGTQNVDLAVNHPLGVATLEINLGTGFDTVDDNANNLIIDEDLFFTGVNHFEHDGLLSVFRDAFIDNSGENENSVFASNGTMTVGDEFTYLGGGGSDEVRLNGVGGATINGAALIDLGDSTGGLPQSVQVDSSNTSFGQSLTVISTSSLGDDTFVADPGTQFHGDINIDLGGGNNQATIVGVFAGGNVSYAGGSGVDNVVYGLTGGPALINASLGAGDDIFDLMGGVNIASPLIIDFGPGNDTFINGYGIFDFDAMLGGLNGFNHNYVFATGSLTSTQVEDVGDITVDNNGLLQSIRFINGGTSTLMPVTHLTIDLLSGTSTNLDLDLDNALAGNLFVELDNGLRNLNFIGANNSIGGNLTITGAADDQIVELAVNNSLTVGGHATISLGSAGGGGDVVDEDANNITIGGNLDLIGVNLFENHGTMTVDGRVLVDNSSAVADSLFGDATTMTIVGNFTYLGGGGSDEVELNGVGGTSIGGDAWIDLGDSIFGGSQAALFDVSTSSVGGSLTVMAANATGGDLFQSTTGASFGGDITVNLGHGTNNANIVGVFGGSNVRYTGGAGVDNVTFGTTGNPADVNVKLGANDDTFTLLAGAAISPTSLRVDFGGGNDTFVNNFGVFTFDARLLNWHGYNRFYDLATDSLNIVQVQDTGDVTVDNNGTGGAIRLVNAFVTEMTPATHVRLNLLPGSSTNVNVDYDLPLAGNTILDLKAGNRNVTFTGDSNQIGGFLRIEAGDGIQNVHLAANADLGVGSSTVINLRGDVDTVQDGAHNVSTGTNFILRSVNDFSNNNTLTIGGKLTMNTTFDSLASVLNNLGTMNIGDRLTYLGGISTDDVLLRSGANIGGVAIISLGASNVPLQSQDVDLSGSSIGGALRMFAGTSFGGNLVLSDAATNVGGDVTLNFSSSTTNNNVTLLGTYSGTYGTYRGGSGMDTVTLGATANNMRFVTRLGIGNDTFNLDAATSLLSLILDGNAGNDTFNDGIGAPYPFPVAVLNIP